jgi:hypothetical protein
LHQPENSEVRRLALSCFGHEVILPFARGELCRRLAVLRQRLLELLFDAERVGGGARLEFPQGMAIALAPKEKSMMIFSALAKAMRSASWPRGFAGCWKFNVWCWKFNDGSAVRPFC